MEAFRRARALFVAAIFAAVFVLGAAPQMYFLLLRARLSGMPDTLLRRQMARWQTRWLDFAFVLMTRVGGIEVEFRFPDHPCLRMSKGPFIIVANHHGGFDGILVSRLISLSGRFALRGVMKKQMASWPVIGRVCRSVGYAFVARSGDPQDIASVERCGDAALAEGADVLIFPEGTTYVPSKAKDGLVHVLPPKSGGLKSLLRTMPGCPILSVTIHWHDYRADRAMFDGIIPPGTRATVSVEVVEGIGEQDASVWLEQEWLRKDALLAG